MGRELTPYRISFTPWPCDLVVLCGISTCFQVLSPCMGQIAHALLTRPPLELKSSSRNLPTSIPARLACVKHAASVRPEPGSNSYVQSIISVSIFRLHARQSTPTSNRTKRLLSQNLTVCLLDLLCSLYRFQGSSVDLPNPSELSNPVALQPDPLCGPSALSFEPLFSRQR